MDRQEFSERLRTALNGRIAANVIQEHVNYYEDYINTQIRLGNSEQDVLDSLGDPRLLAKSIVQASGSTTDAAYEQSNVRRTEGETNRKIRVKSVRLPGWVWGIIGTLAVIAILALIFSILSFLAPIIIVGCVVVFFVKLFRDWLN